MVHRDLPHADRRERTPEPAEPDRRPVWVRRLDERIRVAPDSPAHLRVNRPIR